MKNRTSIVLRSFARITVLPILIFSITAWLVLKFVEPGSRLYGCIEYPEDSRSELVGAIYLMLRYLCVTPVVLLNLSKQISEEKLFRISLLLIPIIPAILGLIMNIRLLLSYDARVFIYLTITAAVSIIIIIWNTIFVNRSIEKLGQTR